MACKWSEGLVIAASAAIFLLISGGVPERLAPSSLFSSYVGECINSNCGTEEITELYSSYSEEIYGEPNPSAEEVAELVGDNNPAHLNQMLQAFLMMGQRVRAQDFPPGAATVPPSITTWIYTGPNFTGDVYNVGASNSQAAGKAFASGISGSSIYAWLRDQTAQAWIPIFGKETSLNIQNLATASLTYPLGPITVTQVSADNILHNGSQTTAGYMAVAPANQLDVFIEAQHNQCATPSCSSFYDATSPVVGSAFNLKSWSAQGFPFQVLINASYFIACSRPISKATCANNTGVLVQNGNTIWTAANPDTDGHTLLDAFLFTNDGHANISLNKNLAMYLGAGGVRTAVGGNYFIQNGAIFPTGTHEPTTEEPRTALGLSADYSRLFAVVIQPGYKNGGVTVQALGDYMLSLGVQNALMLDGGGSSQFLAYGVNPSGNFTVWQTSPGDLEGYRPVPAVLGLRGRSP